MKLYLLHFHLFYYHTYCGLPLGLRTEAKAVQEKHCLGADGTNNPTVDSRPWQRGKVGTQCDFTVDCYTENTQVNVPGGICTGHLQAVL